MCATGAELVLAARVDADMARLIRTLALPDVALACRGCARCLLYERRLPVVWSRQEDIVVVLDASQTPRVLWVNGARLAECPDPRGRVDALYRPWVLSSPPTTSISCCMPDVPTHIQLTLSPQDTCYFENRATVLRQHQWFLCLDHSSHYCFHCNFTIKQSFRAWKKNL